MATQQIIYTIQVKTRNQGIIDALEYLVKTAAADAKDEGATVETERHDVLADPKPVVMVKVWPNRKRTPKV